MQTKIVKIPDIRINSRNRQYRQDKAQELAQSIQEIGLLHPIVVNEDNILIAGLHRLEAAKLLGWEEIPCSIFDINKAEELAEIDENLIRAELTELEKADLLYRAKEIYELRHPESKRFEKVKQNIKPSVNTDNDTMSLSYEDNNGNGLQASAIKGFTENTAEKLNNSTRSIQRLIYISKNITPEAKDVIKNTAIADSKTELLSLARIEPEKQLEVVNILKNGNAKKVREAIYHIRKKSFAKAVNKAEKATNIQYCENNYSLEFECGDIFQLGEHLLICADNTDPVLIEYLKRYHFSFAFADPPYGAGYADYDTAEFTWSQDYISEIADITAVTPGTMSIARFLKLTNMSYRWALACHIKNLHSAGAIGYTHWYFTAIFSNLASINCGAKDYIEITLPPLPVEDKEIAYKRQKPVAYLTWLIDIFSKKGDLILDPFAGSGQTLIVCEALGRRCVTIEILPDMVKKIINRFEGKLGVKHKKIENIYK